MKKLLAFTFLVMALLNSFAQKQKASFEIAGQKIFFALEEKASVTGDEKAKVFYITFLNDSVCYFKKPVSCYRYDTLIVLNPVSLEEEASVTIDSSGITKFNLGSVSKTDLNQAVSNQLGLDKNGFDFKLNTLTVYIFNSHYDSLSIDYGNPADIESAKQKIQTLRSGTLVMIGKLGFENTDERSFYGDFDNVAIMKIKE